jgi:tetratricopeptide (TPR) repeat protein
MKLQFLLIYFIINIFFSCDSQEKDKLTKRKNAIELNDKAVLLSRQYSYQEDSLEKAIALLDQAIMEDSTYTFAYANKVSILCGLGFYNDMLKILNKIETLKKDDPEIIIQQGHTLEKMGKFTDAIRRYKKADKLYTKLIKSKPNEFNYKIGRAYLQMFLTSKEEGIKEYEKIIMHNSEQKVLQVRVVFYEFNKSEFINSYCAKSP